ncbi:MULTISPECIES: efflux RND transporter periplasmic adaptor subunit [unclassified Halomonas]|uniref:efflux RND transporter periplasmic adaptor subunit n=1 Tax=unclassified Halomonas TaxID=2609666 RepID=UPI0013F4E9DC|nr:MULTISPECIES: efflux RND transporter periplasmic adaptor subunit [unclassified Halomonas]MBT2788945.1 efflux RND transporter periplasmic adaptor subunit [Halomonas sp. ISL-106]MBT2799126.1 efflux RND transporter periplasmic adaptor subunit [Halomonas sp. ISL-104]
MAQEQADWWPVVPQSYVQKIGLVGRVEPAELLSINAPFEGDVVELKVAEGSQMLEGEMLLKLDTTQLDIQLREALAQRLQAQRAFNDLQKWEQGQEVARARRTLSSVRLNLNDTVRRLSESRTLLEKGIVPRMEVESLEQQATIQQLDLEAAESELASTLAQGQGENRLIAEMELENATARHEALLALYEKRTLHAPFSGVVISPSSQDGEAKHEPLQNGTHVTQGQPLFTLASTERVRVVAQAEEVDINMLEPGQPVTITGDAFPDFELQGELSFIGVQRMESQGYENGASYLINVSVPPLTLEQQRYIRLGMSAHLHINTYLNDAAMIVPPEAIRQDENGSYIEFRASSQDEPERLGVEIGQSTPSGIEVFGLTQGLVRL